MKRIFKGILCLAALALAAGLARAEAFAPLAGTHIPNAISGTVWSGGFDSSAFSQKRNTTELLPGASVGALQAGQSEKSPAPGQAPEVGGETEHDFLTRLGHATIDLAAAQQDRWRTAMALSCEVRIKKLGGKDLKAAPIVPCLPLWAEGRLTPEVARE